MTQVLKLKYIYISTFIFWMATNLFAPFLAIFALSQLEGVGITEIGIASMVFFLSFGATAIVVARISDKIKGLRDDFLIIFIGFITRGFTLVLFAFSQNLTAFLIIHFFLGITRGFTDASQDKIISKMSTDDLLATSFGVRIGVINFAAAIGAGLGGILIDLIGFRIVLVFVGVLTILSGFLFFYNKKFIESEL